MWQRTCQNLRRWMDEGLDVVPVSVNASRRDFSRTDYLQRLLEPVKEYGLTPELLHIEVTESIIADDPDLIRQVLTDCRARGFQVEMDDFGAGYSSLTLLGQLPLDVLKLDMGLVQQTNDERKARILAATLSLARSLGLKTIAEGVETEEQLQQLRSLDCEGIQGFYFSRPLP